ncbi:general stress protein 26 [Fusibacter sp. A1]|nr:general stress protein 26 [Fusibacter sp. A1]
MIENCLTLVKNAKVAMLGTVDEQGHPNIKAMLNLKTDGLHRIWFSTNTSSKRVQQLLNNNKACVYYYTDNDFMGLMLVGKAEVMRDEASRKLLWFDGCEAYYPHGIDDPDYSVLRFTAESGHYYHNLEKLSFEVSSV